MWKLVSPHIRRGLDVNNFNKALGLATEQVLLIYYLKACNILIHVKLEA